jgi:hypothetical protein
MTQTPETASDSPMNERDLFLRAIELADPAEQQAFLQSACPDAALREKVAGLLRAHAEVSQFLEVPIGEQWRASTPGNQSANESAATLVVRPAAVDLSFLQPPVDPATSLGRLGHYDVREVLGNGAFGIVLKAFDEKLHRFVAIKVLNPQLAATSPPRKRFLREARSTAAIHDPQIVAIHAVEEDPLPYLVMEYVPGQSLQDWLDQHGPLEPREVLQIGRQIALGLAAAHAQHLIHRDIKPANILLEAGVTPVAKLTDFGLARAVDDASLTQSGYIAGTPLYMAPEQAKGQPLDARTDLFSLGSVLYTMVCGRPAFRAPSMIAVLKRVCDDLPRPIAEVMPGTPTWLCAIIDRLLQKEPDDRYQSAAEVAEELQRHLTKLQADPTYAFQARTAEFVHPSPAPRLATHSGPFAHPLLLVAFNGLALLCGLGSGMALLKMLDRQYLAVTVIGGLFSAVSAAWASSLLQAWKTRDRGTPWELRPADAALLCGTFFLGLWGTCLIVSTPTPQGRDFYITMLLVIWCVFFFGILIPRWRGRVTVPHHPMAPHSVAARWSTGQIVILALATVMTGFLLFLLTLGLGFGLPLYFVTMSRTVEVRPMPSDPPVSTTQAETEPLPPEVLPLSLDELLQQVDGLEREGIRAQELASQGLITPQAVVEAESRWLTADAELAERQGDLARVEQRLRELHICLSRRLEMVTTLAEAGTETTADVQAARAALKQAEGLRQRIAERQGRPVPPLESDPDSLNSQKKLFAPRATRLTTLFNGRDLDGWETHPDEPGNWRVEDGILVASGKPSYLFTRRDDFGDFILRAEVNINAGGDSGILIRTPFLKPGINGLPGYETQFQAGRMLVPGWATGSIGSSDGSMGWQMHVPSTIRTEPDQWFEIEVLVRGETVVTRVIGQPNIHVYRDAARRYQSGRIALQHSGPNTRIHFRKLTLIEPLPPTEPPVPNLDAPADAAQPANAGR